MQNLMLPQSFLKPFPSAETVFAEPVARYARHLNPLVSIDLSAVGPALSGWIHLVSPIEPYDGYLDDMGKEAWGPYLQPNWIGFRLTPEHRYELLGDFRFFEIENADETEADGDGPDYIAKHYDEQHASFAAHKAAFEKTGQICRVTGSAGDPMPVTALSRLGGVAPVGNMTWSNVAGAAFTYANEDAAPRTRDGRLYRFIASVPGWNYRDSGADDILLYYDPVERIVLQSFVFT